jgi:hypothetical protein
MPRVCVLSQRELGRLQNYRIKPNHAEHTHISQDEAIAGINADLYRTVGPGKHFHIGVTAQASNGRHWAPRQSGVHMVMQLVSR